MKLAFALLALVFGSCATPVSIDDFEHMNSPSFYMDYQMCSQLANDMRSRFGWGEVPKTQCMLMRGYRLKK